MEGGDGGGVSMYSPKNVKKLHLREGGRGNMMIDMIGRCIKSNYQLKVEKVKSQGNGILHIYL